ncbi:MAG: hypothetical protein ACRCS8_02835 [Brevinema sp.]
MNKGKTWTILEISSAYRDAKNQARVMVDHILVKGKNKLVTTYRNPIRRAPLQLISEVFYEDNYLLSPKDPIHHKTQKALFDEIQRSEKEVFVKYLLSLPKMCVKKIPPLLNYYWKIGSKYHK